MRAPAAAQGSTGEQCAPWRALCLSPSGSGARRCRRVFLAELVDATAGVDDLLFARVERMAVGADFDLQIMSDRRTCLELVSAGAGHGNFFVVRVDTGFHHEYL